ncbi:MAG: protein-glutamate O-methyltransferase CheR [Bacteroidota bacterium]
MMTTQSIQTNGAQLQRNDFLKVKQMIHQYCGIYIQDGKEALVRSRLMKRIRALRLSGFREYLDYIDKDASGKEFLSFVDVLTTNKTNFFREEKHFDFIRDEVLPGIQSRSVKWWSAGCSSGEEPITLAITWLEHQQRNNGKLKILGTDISREILHEAKQGLYGNKKMMDVPPSISRKYFQKAADGRFRAIDEIRSMLTYGRLNLTGKWPLSGPFQIIMCRNVMIYFNRDTQNEIVNRFHDLLEPGGYLFIGHSESIPSDNPRFKNLGPAVYQKR